MGCMAIPPIGYGTYWGLPGPVEWCEEVYLSVREAINAGYRLLDTASGYFVEREVGHAVRDSGIPREDIFVTTKMRISEQGYDKTLRAFEESLSRLGMDYVDMYMLHWPVPDAFLQTYRAVESLYREGRVRMIGISNFERKHFQQLSAVCNVLPVVNQIELHPYLAQEGLADYFAQYGVRLQAWSPFGRGALLKDKALCRIAAAHGKTTAQTVLRWGFQRGVIPIPKGRGEHIRENIDIFDFQLDGAEMDEIGALDRGERCMPYPGILKGDYV